MSSDRHDPFGREESTRRRGDDKASNEACSWLNKLQARMCQQEKDLHRMFYEMRKIYEHLNIPNFDKSEDDLMGANERRIKIRRKDHQISKGFVCKFCYKNYGTGSALKHHCFEKHGIDKTKIRCQNGNGGPQTEYLLSKEEQQKIHDEANVNREEEPRPSGKRESGERVTVRDGKRFYHSSSDNNEGFH